MRTVLVAAAVLAGFIGMASAQVAVTLPCGPPDKIVAALKKYGEQTTGAGMNSNGQPVLLQVNPETGTFTVLFRYSKEVTCLISGGSNWTDIEPGKPGNDL